MSERGFPSQAENAEAGVTAGAAKAALSLITYAESSAAYLSNCRQRSRCGRSHPGSLYQGVAAAGATKGCRKKRHTGCRALPAIRRSTSCRQHSKINFCEVETLIEPLREPSESPEEAVLRSEHRAYLEEGLRVLTVRERAALILRDVEGLPAEEVARRLNCSKATVRSHIANARIKFRRYMERARRAEERTGS